MASSRTLLALLVVALAPACADVGEPAPPAMASVAIGLSEEGVVIGRVYALEDYPIARVASPARLAYQLRDPDDRVVTAGIFPDPRYLREEHEGADGHLEGEFVRQDRGLAHLRLPTVAGELVILDPTAGMGELGRAAFDPTTIEAPQRLRTATATAGSLRAALAGDDDVEPVETIHGSPGAPVRILFLPEGYVTDAELERFEDDARALVRDTLDTEDFGVHADQMWFQVQRVRSEERGLDGGDTAFEMKRAEICADFDDALPGLWNKAYAGSGHGKIEDLADAAGADLVVVLMNETEFRGCVRYPGMIFMHRDADPDLTLAHELGHALFGLGDEYAYGQPDYLCSAFSALGLFTSPNTTTDPHDPPWKDMLTPGIPIPTPAEDAQYDGMVGAYEGASYCDGDDYYRPEFSCRMRQNGAEFCQVCAREKQTFFDTMSNRVPGGEGVDTESFGLCPDWLKGDGTCDPCHGTSDPDCLCDMDGICEPVEERNMACMAFDCHPQHDCGDGSCAIDEDIYSCAKDCGGCEGEPALCGVPEPTKAGCYCDASVCLPGADCCPDIDDVCGGG